MLKQLLQLLLNTRTTPSEAAHNAAPGRIDIGISGQEYICPADGFVTASANAMNVGGFDMQLLRNGLSVQGGPQEVSVPEWTQSAMIPVAKGDTVNISLYNQNSWQWRFISSIGGGYNYLARRALSCLRPSFNCLPRSFFKVNIPTLLINADQVPVHKARQSQETARRISWLHSQVGLSLRLAQTVRQTTHGLGLKTPPEELHTSPMQFANTKRLLSQCKKEMFLLLTSALITRTKAPFCLSLLKQQNNLRTGGALC